MFWAIRFPIDLQLQQLCVHISESKVAWPKSKLDFWILRMRSDRMTRDMTTDQVDNTEDNKSVVELSLLRVPQRDSLG